MFASKAKAYQSGGAPFTKLESLARDKHSSLLGTFVSDEEKKFFEYSKPLQTSVIFARKARSLS